MYSYDTMSMTITSSNRLTQKVGDQMEAFVFVVPEAFSLTLIQKYPPFFEIGGVSEWANE